MCICVCVCSVVYYVAEWVTFRIGRSECSSQLSENGLHYYSKSRISPGLEHRLLAQPPQPQGRLNCSLIF